MEARGSNSKITAAVDDENSVPVQVDDTAVILHDDLEVTEGALNTECPKVVIEHASPHKVEGDYTYEITTDGNVRILAYDAVVFHGQNRESVFQITGLQYTSHFFLFFLVNALNILRRADR